MTPQEIMIEIGRRLALRRRELRLSLAQVASRCEVSLQQVQRYEAGHNIISAPMLWQLSKCLDVPIGYFFETLD